MCINKVTEPVIVVEDMSDVVVIDQQNTFNVNITIALLKSEDFSIKLDFIDLNESDYWKIVEYTKLNRSLEFSSNIVNKEGYNIIDILMVKFDTDSNFNMSWECISDDPNLTIL